MIEVTCPNCNKKFQSEKTQADTIKCPCCSADLKLRKNKNNTPKPFYLFTAYSVSFVVASVLCAICIWFIFSSGKFGLFTSIILYGYSIVFIVTIFSSFCYWFRRHKGAGTLKNLILDLPEHSPILFHLFCADAIALLFLLVGVIFKIVFSMLP